MYNSYRLRSHSEAPPTPFGWRRPASQPIKEGRARQAACHSTVIDHNLMEMQSQAPNDLSSAGPIDVILQMSTQHRVYRAMLLMSKPSGLLPTSMLPEEVRNPCPCASTCHVAHLLYFAVLALHCRQLKSAPLMGSTVQASYYSRVSHRRLQSF